MMKFPPTATHMVSLADGKPQNNALGYCTSSSRNPDTMTTLTPCGKGWPMRVWQGTKVIVKWLQLPGQPEFLHTLDGETSTSMKLPRRLKQRSQLDVVTVATMLSEHSPVDTLLYYGTTSIFAGNAVTITPLDAWRYALPAGCAVRISNLSDPTNPIKSGSFATQATVIARSRDGVRFLKDTPGGA